MANGRQKQRLLQVIFYLMPKKLSTQPESNASKQKTILHHLMFPKKTWNDQQDEVLMELVAKHGPKKWSNIARYIPNRIGKQCRQRWFNHLDPSINKSQWSDEEQQILFLAWKIYGSRWSKLTRFLKGRTDNCIKNHWNSIMRKKLIKFTNKLCELNMGEQPSKQQLINLLNTHMSFQERIEVDPPELTSMSSSFMASSNNKSEDSLSRLSLIRAESNQSDQFSMRNLLRKIDQKEENTLKRIQSYQYQSGVLGSSQKNNLECKEEKIKNQSQNTIEEKENWNKIAQLIEEEEIPPLPPLKKVSSSMALFSTGPMISPYKQIS